MRRRLQKVLQFFLEGNLEKWCKKVICTSDNKKNTDSKYFTVKIGENLCYGISVEGGEKNGIYKYGILRKTVEYVRDYYYLWIKIECKKMDSFGNPQCFTLREYENLEYKLKSYLNDDKWGFKEVVIDKYAQNKKYEPVYDSIHTWKVVGKKFLYSYYPMVIKLKF